jgi:hypothetical protein
VYIFTSKNGIKIYFVQSLMKVGCSPFDPKFPLVEMRGEPTRSGQLKGGVAHVQKCTAVFHVTLICVSCQMGFYDTKFQTCMSGSMYICRLRLEGGRGRRNGLGGGCNGGGVGGKREMGVSDFKAKTSTRDRRQSQHLNYLLIQS